MKADLTGPDNGGRGTPRNSGSARFGVSRGFVTFLLLVTTALPIGATFVAMSGARTHGAAGLIAVIPRSNDTNPYLETGPGLEDRAYRMAAQLETDAARGKFPGLDYPGARLSLENQRGSGRYEPSSTFIKIQARSDSSLRSSDIVGQVVLRARELSDSTDEAASLITANDQVTVVPVANPESDDEGSSQSIVAISIATIASIAIIGYAAATRQFGRGRPIDTTGSLELPPDSTSYKWLAVFVGLLIAIPAGLSIPGLPVSVSPASFIALLAGVVLGLTWLAGYQTPIYERTPISTTLVILVTAFVLSIVYALARSLPSDEAHASYRTAITFVPYLAVYALACRSSITYDAYTRLRRLVGYAAAILAVLALLQVSGVFDYSSVVALSGVLRRSVDIATTLERTGSVRVTGTTSHPIELGFVCACTFFLPLTNLTEESSLRRVLASSLLSSIILSGAAVSVSRTAFIGIVLAFLVLIALWRGVKQRVLFVIALIASFVALTVFYSSVSRVVSLFTRSASDTSIAGRLRDYNSAYTEFVESPLTGRGLGTRIYGKYNVLDNQYLLTALEVGAAGLAALILVYAAAFYVLARIRRDTNDGRMLDESAAVLAAFTLIVFGTATFDIFSFSVATTLVFIYLAFTTSLSRIAGTPSSTQRRTNTGGHSFSEAGSTERGAQ